MERNSLSRAFAVAFALLAAAALLRYTTGAAAGVAADGTNPHPVHLHRPAAAPLSAIALLGKQIFNDPALSASGRLSCASCHDQARAYGPPDGNAVRLGGPGGRDEGNRAVPGLGYLYRVPNFSIGPDINEQENVDLNRMADQSAGLVRAQKTVGATTSAVAMVPQGGLFWDGRVNTLQDQAKGPLLNPVEMANPDIASVAAKLKAAPYAASLSQIFGPGILATPARLVDEALFAVARFQVEDPSFHPYTSKYDYWLEGRARLSATELRGLRLFEDKDKANCAGCHLDRPSRDGLPPLFTDFQYEGLGVPRNKALADNRDPRYFDLGLCGPVRQDIRTQTRYCGMFRTPSLRNVAERKVFFHNGVYHDLDQVMAFYDFRDVQPGKVYPHGADGKPHKFDDVPAAYLANMDVVDPPFDRRPGQAPAMTEQDMRDIIAFLGTLTDGYQAVPVLASR
jgi:cytochrome c peroxidase